MGGPAKGEEDGDGDPEQEGISPAHVDVDLQNVVAAAAAAAVVVDGVAVGSPVVVEERYWGGERGAAKGNIEKR